MTGGGRGEYLKLIVVESCEYRGSSWELVAAGLDSSVTPPCADLVKENDWNI